VTVDPRGVPQRVVLVLPSTGQFDSRAFRIATTLVMRGHEVTVIARLMPGVPPSEDHPAGYRIVRVRVSARDGIPLRGLLRRIRGRVRRIGPARPPGRRAVDSGQVPPGQASAAVGATRRGPRGTGNPALRAYEHLVRRFAIPLTIRAYVRAAAAVVPPADLYHGMAYMGIPVALALGRRDRAPVVYDARDIYMEARSMARRRGLARWALAAAERRWARRASSVITVNDDYADEMARRLRVTRPLVVMNCSYRFDPPRPRERRFHDLLQLDASTHVVLYHGGLFPERGIEQLMEAILEVPDAVLVLMGYGVLEADLRVRAAEPRYAGRVHLVPPVEPQELHPWIACADIGAMLIQPTTLNHRLTTPNKLFESMAAGVPVVVSDVPGMARIVKETGIGAVCDGTDPTSISEALRQLLADPTLREVMGRRALAAAHASYNWDRQAKRLLHEYERLTGKPW
jgi:glycosyltransferase involved in cell wall biosynthesis